MPRVTFDHNPNEGAHNLTEEEILDIERMGFSVTRVDGGKKTTQSEQKKESK
jgi:hypothetical protein